MKTKTILIAAVMILGISAAAFAQATYDVSSIPVTTVVNSGYVEKTGDLKFRTITEEYTVTGTITIDYGAAIDTSLAQINYIPDPADLGTLPTVTFEQDLEHFGRLVLRIVPATATPALSYAFRLEGVRMSMVAYNAPRDVTITSIGNLIHASRDELTLRVIDQEDYGLDYITGDGPTYVQAATGDLLSQDDQNLFVGEGFYNAFGMTVASDDTQNTTQMIKIGLTDDQEVTLARNKAFRLPAGITVCFEQYDSTGKWQLADRNGSFASPPSCLGSGSYTSNSGPAVYYRLISDSDILNVEELHFYAEVDADEPSEAYDTDLHIYAYASLAPIEIENNPNAIPRYMEVPTPVAEIVSFVPSSTTLMIPYSTTEVGYNVGLSVANTTLDPGEDVMHFSSAQPQDGKMVFYFYPVHGDWFSYSTASADPPGTPLLAGGKLARGKSYVLLLSELLTAAGHQGEEFSGYIIIQCDFSNAHGQYFVSDFEAFTNGAQMLVLNSRMPYLRARERHGRIYFWYEDSGRRYGPEGANH